MDDLSLIDYRGKVTTIFSDFLVELDGQFLLILSTFLAIQSALKGKFCSITAKNVHPVFQRGKLVGFSCCASSEIVEEEDGGLDQDFKELSGATAFHRTLADRLGDHHRLLYALDVYLHGLLSALGADLVDIDAVCNVVDRAWKVAPDPNTPHLMTEGYANCEQPGCMWNSQFPIPNYPPFITTIGSLPSLTAVRSALSQRPNGDVDAPCALSSHVIEHEQIKRAQMGDDNGNSHAATLGVVDGDDGGMALARENRRKGSPWLVGRLSVNGLTHSICLQDATASIDVFLSSSTNQKPEIENENENENESERLCLNGCHLMSHPIDTVFCVSKFRIVVEMIECREQAEESADPSSALLLCPSTRMYLAVDPRDMWPINAEPTPSRKEKDVVVVVQRDSKETLLRISGSGVVRGGGGGGGGEHGKKRKLSHEGSEGGAASLGPYVTIQGTNESGSHASLSFHCSLRDSALLSQIVRPNSVCSISKPSDGCPAVRVTCSQCNSSLLSSFPSLADHHHSEGSLFSAATQGDADSHVSFRCVVLEKQLRQQAFKKAESPFAPGHDICVALLDSDTPFKAHIYLDSSMHVRQLGMVQGSIIYVHNAIRRINASGKVYFSAVQGTTFIHPAEVPSSPLTMQTATKRQPTPPPLPSFDSKPEIFQLCDFYERPAAAGGGGDRDVPMRLQGYVRCTVVSFVSAVFEWKCSTCKTPLLSNGLCRHGCVPQQSTRGSSSSGTSSPHAFRCTLLCLADDGSAQAELFFFDDVAWKLLRATAGEKRHVMDLCSKHGRITVPRPKASQGQGRDPVADSEVLPRLLDSSSLFSQHTFLVKRHNQMLFRKPENPFGPSSGRTFLHTSFAPIRESVSGASLLVSCPKKLCLEVAEIVERSQDKGALCVALLNSLSSE